MGRTREREAQLSRTNVDLDRKVFDLQALLKAGEALYDVLEVAPLCDLLMAMCRERARVHQLAVLLHDDEADPPVLRVRAVQGLPEETLRLEGPASDGILWRLLLAGDPFSVVTPGGEPRFPYIFGEHGLSALQGQLWIPLVMPGRVVGVVSVGLDRDGQEIRAEDREFLGSLCSQAAVAINTANLYESIKVARKRQARSFHQLEILFDVAKKLGEVSDLTKMLRIILGKATGAVDAEKGSLMMVDENTEELVIRVVEGLPDPRVQRRINDGEIQCKRFKRGEGTAGQVWESGKPQRVNNVEADGSFQAADNNHVRSLLCVPMKVDDEVIGVINITNRKDNQPFVDSDETILQALADQAAIAIARAKLYEAAITDGLTGLFIRRFAIHRLREEVKRARRYDKPLSVIMCDIDHFKRVNDTYGHPAGDAVIIACADVLRAGTRLDIDVAGRYGGEEFLIVLPETDLQGGVVAAERLRAAFEATETSIGGGKTLKKTMSFGVTCFGPDDDADSLVKRSDEALYMSKEGGRNCVHALPWVENPSIVDPALAVETSGELPAATTPADQDDAAA
jgi:diguanylate cyclase (GGDEF)-like protein